ncbi:MAG TPA: enoyl-CoA hydratase/isomerase family protein [Clostridia bacterium]
MNNPWSLECEKGIGILTFSNPPRNFLDYNAITELGKAFDIINEKDDVKVVVVKSIMQDAFISGADINIFRHSSNEDISRFVTTSRAIFKKIEDSSKPVISAVEGVCLGGGCEFIMCCDIKVAGEGATFGLPEIIYGLIPGGGGIQRLSRLTNRGRALKMLLTGFSVKAKEAFEYGLVDEVVESGKALSAALKIAGRIAMQSPLAIKYIKERVNNGLEMNLEKAYEEDEIYFNRMIESQDSKEGMEALTQRRLPKYSGK